MNPREAFRSDRRPATVGWRRLCPALLVLLAASACAPVARRGDGTPGEIARAGAAGPAWTAAERAIVEARRPDFDVVERGGPGADVLRRHARVVAPGAGIAAVAGRMEAAMRRTGGVGIAAPQVGLSIRLVVLQVDWRTDRPRVLYALDPVVTERSDDVQDSWEGCLSVPGKGGLVRRSREVTVSFRDPATGEARTERADGPNAVLWQHELDHLDGVLYVDRLVGDLLPIEEMRRRRDAAGPPSPPR